MTQLPKQADNYTLDRQQDRRGRYRKLKIIGVTALLVIGAPIVLFITGALGLTGLVGGLVGSGVSPKSNITRPAVADPSVKKRAAMKQAISRFEDAEQQRLKKFKKSQVNVKNIAISAQKSLRKESALIAGRIVNARFGANLSWATIKTKLPVMLGRNPAAVNQVVNQAVGTESAKIMDLADKEFAGEIQAIGERSEPKKSRKTSQDAASLQLRLGKQIILRAPDALGVVAKKYGVGVAGRAVAKLPAAALDGPVPAAEAILFAATVADIYSQGGAAQSDLTDTIRGVVFKENRAALKRKTAAAFKKIQKDDRLARKRNCEELRSAYDLNPVSDMKATVDKLCKA